MDVTRIILIGMVIVVGLLATILLARAVEAVSNATSPVERVRATLVNKRQSGTGSDTRYLLTFDIDDDETITCTVPVLVYQQFDKGARGTLEHKGTRFIGFTRPND